MKLLPLAAAVMAAALTLATAAYAAGPLPPPPVAGVANGGSAANTIFDAMVAIVRAVANSPAGAQRATFAYDQAIQQFNAGQYEPARQTALSAIAQTAPAPLPAPSLYPLYIPQPAYHPMPLVVNADEGDAESTAALARGQLAQCGNGTPPPTVVQQYNAAVADLVAKNYLTSRGEAEALINYCAAQMQAVVQAAANAPALPATPIPMGSYSPVPIATLIPDPALAQPGAVMPAPSPTPPSHRSHLFGL